MTAPSAVSAVSVAAEARRRKERRRRIGFWASIVAMLVVIGTVVVLALGFNGSWWVQTNPVASSDQLAPDGSSKFSQTGIDYFTRAGLVDVNLSGTRPTATGLGLADSGAKHVNFLVPLTVTVSATKKVTFPLVEGIDLTSSRGRLAAIEITPNAPYEQLIGDVRALAPEVGWSDSAVSGWENELVTSRQAHNGDSFTATIGPAASTGMRVSATLSGDKSSAPVLVIRLAASGS